MPPGAQCPCLAPDLGIVPATPPLTCQGQGKRDHQSRWPAGPPLPPASLALPLRLPGPASLPCSPKVPHKSCLPAPCPAWERWWWARRPPCPRLTHCLMGRAAGSELAFVQGPGTRWPCGSTRWCCPARWRVGHLCAFPGSRMGWPWPTTAVRPRWWMAPCPPTGALPPVPMSTTVRS